ncbi:MAG: hypothetical protein JNM44_02450 [Chitinophagaceae bacterium]|nr:hypothetical protein [Chitinophagaceae bacterium]
MGLLQKDIESFGFILIHSGPDGALFEKNIRGDKIILSHHFESDFIRVFNRENDDRKYYLITDIQVKNIDELKFVFSRSTYSYLLL